MHSLHEIQTRCRRAFVQGDADALSWLSGQADSELPAVGISIYRNNVRETFRQALAASYPVVEDLVGRECFAGLSWRFLRRHPSRTPDLQTFNEQFPDFLDGYYAKSAHGYLADVARLELATEQVLLEPELAPLDPTTLASIPTSDWPGLRLVRSPSARLVMSDFPILDIWRMHYHDQSLSISLDAGPSYVLIVRDAGDSVMRPLSPLEFETAHRLFEEQSIGEIFESLNQSGNADGFQLALANLLRYRIFVHIR
jgi:hypothetical protein